MTGNCRVPSANNSSSAPSSVRTLRERNGIWCLPRNSLVRKQLVQPGCQYTLIGSPAGTVGPVMIGTVVAAGTLTLPLTRNNQPQRYLWPVCRSDQAPAALGASKWPRCGQHRLDACGTGGAATHGRHVERWDWRYFCRLATSGCKAPATALARAYGDVARR